MRFIVMHKVDAEMEAGAPPSAEIIEKMGALVGGSIQRGVFIDGAGLHRSARRVRMRFSKGTAKVTPGPLQGGNELVGGMVMIEASSMDAAIEHARRYGAFAPDGELDIGPVVEPWDIGVVPKPDKLDKAKFLLVLKGEGAPVEALAAELRQHGVLLKSFALGPSKQAARARPTTPRHWVDGPFAESKELIAGFSILELPTRADAIAWAEEYAAILVVNEIDVRPLAT